MKIRKWFATGLIMLVLAEPGLSQTAGPAQSQKLTDEIAVADQALFSAFFDRCDLPALAKMVTDDFEMFHDKNGFMTKSGKEFLDGIAGTCARQKTGEDYRARRELVPGTLKVYPLDKYGAVEVGVIASTSCCRASPRNWSRSRSSRTSGRRTKTAGSCRA